MAEGLVVDAPLTGGLAAASPVSRSCISLVGYGPTVQNDLYVAQVPLICDGTVSLTYVFRAAAASASFETVNCSAALNAVMNLVIAGPFEAAKLLFTARTDGGDSEVMF